MLVHRQHLSMELHVTTPLVIHKHKPKQCEHSNPKPDRLRLRKLLGTSFTDQATIEAPQTLSELYNVFSPVHLQQWQDGGDIDFDDD